MSNVSIYEKNWINLVFEGKNKAYGAYQLRQENSRTTLLAFFVGASLLLSLSGLGLLLSSFKDEIIINPDIPIRPTVIPLVLPPRPEVIPVRNKTLPQHQNPVEEPNLSHMVVAATPQVVVDVPTNKDMNNEPTTTNGTTEGTGTTETNTPGTNTSIVSPVDNEPKPSVLLDKLPAYPGGIEKFYKYVGTNFERPSFDEATVVTVLVSFVIEIDGSITDIKILRNPGYGMDKEATRVLKSLKVKWSPGIMNGEKVRTLYTLPIKVKSE